MSNDIMNKTREIRIKTAKKLQIQTFVYKPSERRRDSDILYRIIMEVEKNLGSTKLMNPIKEIIMNICVELNKSDRDIHYDRLLNLCDTVLAHI
jgi:hypothetical protein